MDRATSNYNNFYTLHIDTILLHDENYFDAAGKLNGKGYKEFWLYINEELERFIYKRKSRPTKLQKKEKGHQPTYHNSQR